MLSHHSTFISINKISKITSFISNPYAFSAIFPRFDISFAQSGEENPTSVKLCRLHLKSWWIFDSEAKFCMQRAERIRKFLYWAKINKSKLSFYNGMLDRKSIRIIILTLLKIFHFSELPLAVVSLCHRIYKRKIFI